MDKQLKSSLYFNDYLVKKVEFEVNENFKNNEQSIKIDFDISHETRVKDKLMTIKLDVKVLPDMVKNDYPFSINVELIGFFSLDGDTSEIKSFEKNALAIMFPYVRSLVSTYTSNSNVPTLILPPINIVNYLKMKEDQK